MAITPTLDLHPEIHNEFNFAPDTDSEGCCCCWRSRPAKKAYMIDNQNRLRPVERLSMRARIEANRRLANILKKKFEDDPIDNDKAFEMLKFKINYDLDNHKKITDDVLTEIINAIYEVKKEIAAS